MKPPPEFHSDSAAAIRAAGGQDGRQPRDTRQRPAGRHARPHAVLPYGHAYLLTDMAVPSAELACQTGKHPAAAASSPPPVLSFLRTAANVQWRLPHCQPSTCLFGHRPSLTAALLPGAGEDVAQSPSDVDERFVGLPRGDWHGHGSAGLMRQPSMAVCAWPQCTCKHAAAMTARFSKLHLHPCQPSPQRRCLSSPRRRAAPPAPA